MHCDHVVEALSPSAKGPANMSCVLTSLHLFNKIADYAFKLISQRQNQTSSLTISLGVEHMASEDTQISLSKLGFWPYITWRPHLAMSCKASEPLYAALCSFETTACTDGKARGRRHWSEILLRFPENYWNTDAVKLMLFRLFRLMDWEAFAYLSY